VPTVEIEGIIEPSRRLQHGLGASTLDEEPYLMPEQEPEREKQEPEEPAYLTPEREAEPEEPAYLTPEREAEPEEPAYLTAEPEAEPEEPAYLLPEREAEPEQDAEE
jgi:hypothetical protein